MRVWITKYALTQGIYEKEAELSFPGNEDMIEVITTTSGPKEFYHHKGKDWHTSREDAVERAEQMREQKILSLKKQIKKLGEMKF